MSNQQHVLQLLRKKLGFFEAILELTESEMTISNQKQWSAILEQKTILLSCIDSIDNNLKPYGGLLRSMSEDIANELDKIKDVIKIILQIDSENRVLQKQEFGFYEKR